MTITATQFRKDIYNIIDKITTTKQTVIVTLKNQKVIVSCLEKPSRLTRLKKRNILNCSAEELIHTDWEKTWTPFI